MKKLLISLLIVGIVGTAFAVDRIQIRKFAGLNTRLNPYEIANEESPDMSNFTLDTAGTLSERNLFQHYNSVSAGTFPITNVYKFYKTSDVGYMVCAGSTKLFKASSNALTVILTDNTVTTGSYWGFETFLGNDGINGSEELCFAANVGAKLLTWNGTNASFQDRCYLDGGKGPGTNCNILKKHKSRLWAAGSSSYPYRIYYSSLNNGIDWNTSGGSIDLPSYEKIMALETLSDVLYIFTRQAIYALGGDTPNEFYIQKTRSTIGTHATKSVVWANRWIMFLNKSGIYAFDGDTSTNLSEPIQPTIDAISTTYLDKSAAIYDNRGRYRLSITSASGSYNDTILIYDTVLKQWYELSGINLASFFKAEGGNDRGELYAGSSDNSGWLWQLQTEAATEQVSHATKSQLQTGVTFNTVYMGTEISPLVLLEPKPYYSDSYTVVLLHFDGLDAATSTKDISPTPKAFTFVNQAQLDGTYHKFPLNSLLLDGTDDEIYCSNHADFDCFTNLSATVDCWVRFNALPSTISMPIAGQFNTGIAQGGWLWRLKHDGFVYTMEFLYSTNGANVFSEVGDVIDMATNTWYHFALVIDGTTGEFFLNGESVGDFPITSIFDSTTNMIIGEGGGGTDMNGWIDEFRISSIPRWSSNFIVPYNKNSGTLTSANLKIGAADQSSLGTIAWQETLGTNTDIQFTTRTGVTDDTTYDTWITWNSVESKRFAAQSGFWVSTSTSVFEITNATVGSGVAATAGHYAPNGLWDLNDTQHNSITDGTNQTRNVLFYEWDDHPNPDCVAFNVAGATSKNDYIETLIPPKNLSSYKWVGFWLKSPVTGDSVRLDIGEVSPTTATYSYSAKVYTTANTVDVNTWEYHYLPLTLYDSTDIDNIKWLRLTYLGDDNGSVYLGKGHAYDFLDSGETITSTPNDYIQYKAIFGSTINTSIPQLINAGGYVVIISYEIAGSTTESAISSYWQSKIFDLGNEYKKLWQWAEFTLNSSSFLSNDTVYLDYDVDDGYYTGTVTGNMVVTGRDVKMRFYLPTGTKGKSLQLKIREDDLDSDLKIHNLTIRLIQEGGM